MRSSILFRVSAIALISLAFAGATDAVAGVGVEQTTPLRVQVTKSGSGWQLLRDGKPYFIKGGGGGGPKDLLAQLGGNSFRTWGVGDDTQSQLDQAQKLGL